MSDRLVPLLPRLGATPRSPWPLAPLLVAVAALGSLWWRPDRMPGLDDFPDGEGTAQLYWSLFETGLSGYLDDRRMMYPVGADRLLQNGLAVDGLVLWPWVALFGLGLGWTVAHAFLLAVVGLGWGWLAGRWWRSGAAAAVAGVVVQLAGITLRELAYGRPTQVFLLALLPFSLAPLLDAVYDRAPRRALVGGALLGLAVLPWWYAAVVALPLLGLVALFAVAERQPATAALLHYAAGLGAVVAPFLLLVLPHLGDLGGMETGADGAVQHGAGLVRLSDLLTLRGSLFSTVEERGMTLRPLTAALTAIGVLAPDRVRRRLLPALVLLVVSLLALGPAVAVGPVRFVLPFRALLDLPLVRRFWWPDRFLLLAAPAVALLVAGAVQRWRPGAVVAVLVALVAEATLSSPWMPLPAASASPSGAARWLAQGQGPALVLPSRAGALSIGAGILRDHPFHGRPLLNGMVAADNTVAPPGWQAIATTGVLGDLLACEHGTPPAEGTSPAANLAALRRLGATDVVLDTERFDPTAAEGAAYVTCIATLLGPGIAIDGGWAWPVPATIR